MLARFFCRHFGLFGVLADALNNAVASVEYRQEHVRLFFRTFCRFFFFVAPSFFDGDSRIFCFWTIKIDNNCSTWFNDIKTRTIRSFCVVDHWKKKYWPRRFERTTSTTIVFSYGPVVSTDFDQFKLVSQSEKWFVDTLYNLAYITYYPPWVWGSTAA